GQSLPFPSLLFVLHARGRRKTRSLARHADGRRAPVPLSSLSRRRLRPGTGQADLPLQQAVASMDYIRFALISALAIVSYLLLLAWNEDYPAQVATPPAQTQTTAGVDSSADLPSDLPQAPQTPAADIPPAPQQPGAAGQTQGQANAANFITVST